MNLKEIRISKSITQKELERLSGIDQQTISRIELGTIKNPSWETVSKLAKALNVSPEKLFPVDQKTA